MIVFVAVVLYQSGSLVNRLPTDGQTLALGDLSDDAPTRQLGHDDEFLPWGRSIDDDHLPFRAAGIDAIDLIDFRYGGDESVHDRTWDTVNDTMDMVCAESLQIVGDVVYHSLGKIHTHFGLQKDE